MRLHRGLYRYHQGAVQIPLGGCTDTIRELYRYHQGAVQIPSGGCTDTIREWVLKAVFGGKIPCCTWDANLPQYCAWHFSWMLYRLNYSYPLRTCFSRISAFDFITNLVFSFWIFGVVTWQIGVCADKLLCVSVTGPSGATSTLILSEAVL